MATKKITITIPDYLSIDKFQQLQNLDHLTDLSRIVRIISIISGIDEDEIKTWMPSDIKTVYQDVSKCMEHGESFYPVFESKNGQLYGYSNVNEMTLGEFTDLERLCKEPNKNLHEIVAILYRPIKKHKFTSFTWKMKHTFKVNMRDVGNVFKYYTLKKYDANDRIADAEQLKDMPIQFALGALGFFLGTANGYLNLTNKSLPEAEEMRARKIDRTLLNLIVAIGGGLRQYIHSPRRIFSLSQEKNVLPT